MKFNPFLLLACASLVAADHLDDWVNTDRMDRSAVSLFNDAIDNCDAETHSHDMFVHCINDHIHYFRRDFTQNERDDIRRGARNSDVNRRGRDGRGGRDGRNGNGNGSSKGGRNGRDGRDGRDNNGRDGRDKNDSKDGNGSSKNGKSRRLLRSE